MVNTKIDKSLTPRVGVQVLVVKNGLVLIGEDTTKGENLYGVPGGWWDNGETLIDAGKRETLEESGIDCENLKFINIYEFFREDKRVSCVSSGYVSDYISGEPKDDVEEGRLNWKWITVEESLRLNLNPAGRSLIEEYVKMPNK